MVSEKITKKNYSFIPVFSNETAFFLSLRKLFQITVYWSANSRYIPATMICIQFVTCSINKLEIHLHTIHSNQNTLTVFNKYTWYTVIYPMWFYWNVQIIWSVIIYESHNMSPGISPSVMTYGLEFWSDTQWYVLGNLGPNGLISNNGACRKSLDQNSGPNFYSKLVQEFWIFWF